jgi:hypothetical protein
MIYFVEAVGTGLVKIGFTKNVNDRLCSLRRGNATELRLLKVLPGGLNAEAACHARWDPHRVRGEWFSLLPIAGEIGELSETTLWLAARTGQRWCEADGAGKHCSQRRGPLARIESLPPTGVDLVLREIRRERILHPLPHGPACTMGRLVELNRWGYTRRAS